MNKKELIELEYPSSEGWMWHEEFCKTVGVKSVLAGSKTVGGKRYERQGTPRLYRYRVVGDAEESTRAKANSRVNTFRHSDSCLLCAKTVTKNRAWVISGATFCGACAKKVTVGGDNERLALSEKSEDQSKKSRNRTNLVE